MIAPGPTLGACSNAEIVDEFRERINISFLGHRAEHPRGNSGLVLRRFWTMHALETRTSCRRASPRAAHRGCSKVRRAFSTVSSSPPACVPSGSHRPFGVPDRRSAFPSGRGAIETTVLEFLDEPRASFVEHTAETPWSTVQLGYFAGAGMWFYPTPPFSFALPGLRTAELDPWDEAGQHRRGGCASGGRPVWPPTAPNKLQRTHPSHRLVT